MTDNQLVPTSTSSDLAAIASDADAVAAQNVFYDYTSRRAENTLRRQRGDLVLFARYLETIGIHTNADILQTTADAWANISWGLVDGFIKWSLLQGYAIGTVNVRLSTVKRYAGLAFKAGAITDTAHALIRQVQGYSHKESLRIDEKREAEDVPTRVGDKKQQAVRITTSLARQLKHQPDTPQGRRDRLLMTLLLDHGLRVGEVARLQVSDINWEAEELRFYRPKVDKVQIHELNPGMTDALESYDLPEEGLLLRGSRKGGKLTNGGMSERAISGRVRVLGEALGIEGLSAHDCRHYWATRAARQGIDAFRLQEAGGWNSLAMPRRYIEDAKVANAGWEW